jgi:methanogenic corrinoid protein MtbC1/DNA-binding transcriptional ArsR family regulator
MVRLRDPDGIAQALADPSRRAILEALRLGRKSVTELCEVTGLKQPNLSNHLAKMRHQNVVRAERAGRFMYYSLEAPFAEVLLRLHAVATLGVSRKHEGNGTASGEQPANLNRADAGDLAEQLLSCLLQGDEASCSNLLNYMLSLKFSMTKIYMEVFQPALQSIGDLYELGQVDEAHEHVASAIIERLMARVSEIYHPNIQVERRAIMGCVAGNLHSLGIRMLADSLDAIGWRVTFVGANVPTASFVELVATEAPNLVVISIALAEQVTELQALLADLRALRDMGQEFWTALGGNLNLGQSVQVRADEFVAQDLEEFMSRVSELTAAASGERTL